MTAKITIAVKDEAHEGMKALIEKLGFKDESELFNNALTLYEWAVTEIEKGNDIAAIDEIKRTHEHVVMPAFKAYRDKLTNKPKKPKLELVKK